MFDICFEKKDSFYEEEGFFGRIFIDSFNEAFFSNTSFFNEVDYQKQWCQAVEVLFHKKKSYFLVNVYDPKVANFFTSWPCYLHNESIYLQNRMLLSEQFNLDKIISFESDIDDLSFVGDEGRKISTWRTDIKSMIDFKNKIERSFL
ncbi:hypothetical protein AA0313_2881 [Acetobacter indonesiensis NRIC 0313]|uniref:CdiI C-terminal domain-containing protein n=1 Tax=Acetobacter indonesiensis TaxID=104101 RepID=A0A6N3T7H7_9PROT|nr:hypothetical protein [Acetobacter indonesiensis]GAN64162.1 hypothetical protein Abin_057_002 [Acetobacter indonesiensis]GBQ62042.1 hypothetical protein AA0313_2881 [Acetobacter indonesiensis NRIC 0313]GEN04913.1 hypothetical protein AIN02nite_29380 [Acetobacter indonesiensis]